MITNTGWRKPTPELCISQQYAKVGEGMSVPKMQALIAVKRVSSKIGLRAADMILLDLLCALSQPQDWEEGARPIVWPSNHYLAEQLGLSERAVQRHTRKLGDLGLISFKDNSNGHRRGKRDASGRIIEAYGFDLSPLQARAGEFELLHEEITADRQFIKAMRKRITVSRRSIRGMIHAAIEMGLQESFAAEWSCWTAKLDRLIEYIPKHSASSSKVAEVAQAFITLYDEVTQAYENALNIDGAAEEQINATDEARSIFKNTALMAKSTSQPGTDLEQYSAKYNHINVTNKADVVKLPIANQNDLTIGSSVECDKIQQRYSSTGISNEPDCRNSAGKDEFNLKIAPNMVTRSCPEFSKYAKAMGVLDGIAEDKSWNDLTRAADTVRPSIGISDDAWNDAKKMIGQNSAAIAMALIFEKYHAEEISSPGGYLRALTSRSEIGELHLTKSIYGRLSNQ